MMTLTRHSWQMRMRGTSWLLTFRRLAWLDSELSPSGDTGAANTRVISINTSDQSLNILILKQSSAAKYWNCLSVFYVYVHIIHVSDVCIITMQISSISNFPAITVCRRELPGSWLICIKHWWGEGCWLKTEYSWSFHPRMIMRMYYNVLI